MLELVLLLAHTCVAEIDLQDSADECVVMWSIAERKAEQRGIELGRQVRAHGAYWRNPRAQRARPWIPQLGAHGVKPADWPRRRSWRRELPKWHRYVDAAERFAVEHFKGTPHPLRCSADDFGGPVDGKHADDAAPCAGAVAVECLPGARQAYWNTGPCRAARRARGRVRVLPAHVAAGRPR